MFNTLDKLNKKPNSDPENTNNIYYDYYDTPIYYNHFEKNVETSGYIKILYKNTENINRPNLTFYPELKTFDIKALYIFKKLHDIPDMDFDGELVVEHVSKTNQSGLVYTCFPLKTRTNSVFSYKNPSDFIDEFAPALSQYPFVFGSNAKTSTDIDVIIENAGSPSRVSTFDIINLNKYIKSKKECIVYKDNANTVVIFTTPILVSSEFTNFTQDANLFSKRISDSTSERRTAVFLHQLSFNVPQKGAEMNELERLLSASSMRKGLKESPLSNVDNYGSENLSRTENKNTKKTGMYEPKRMEGFQSLKEGMGGEAYVDCYPIDIDGTDMATMYEIPVNSGVLNQTDTSEFTKTTSYFITFIILTLSCYLVVPFVYETFIVKLVNVFGDEGQKANRLKTINFLIVIFLLIIGFFFFTVGGLSEPKNIPIYSTGLWIMIFTILICICFIMNTSLMEHLKPKLSSVEVSDEIINSTDLLDFFKDSFGFLREKGGYRAGILFAVLFVAIFMTFYSFSPNTIFFDVILTLFINYFAVYSIIAALNHFFS